MSKRKRFEDTRPLTDNELEALVVSINSSDDEEIQSSGSEYENNLENDFSPSESEYEPGVSDAESTDSDQSKIVRQKRYKHSEPVASTSGLETLKINDSIDGNETETLIENFGERDENLEETNEQNVLEDKNHNIENEQTGLRKSLRGKNGHRWCTSAANRSKRISKRNIIHIMQGSVGDAREAQTPLDVFRCLLNDSIFEKILIHTNTEVRTKSENYKVSKSTISSTSPEELHAFVGILIFAGVQKDNHLSTREMFDYKKSGSIYRATLSCERFEFLLDNLRFDDKTTRVERRQLDRFAPIREIWNEFILNCNRSYKPGSYITIDEQLLAFRGRCPFRMYIPSKPAKYGMKIVMCCDVRTKYMFAAEPYIGKDTDTNGVPLGEYYVKKLTESLHGSNRNITMDNWFTSVNLADQLLKAPYKLIIVGTMRHNKREVPPEMINLRNREVGNSIFCYDREKTLVSYKTKRNKSVLLLSTMHEGSTICPDTGKPDIILFYNKTKGMIDAFDQMCGSRSCSRKTRRWPVCMFYGMLNMACINSWIIFNTNLQRNGKKIISRKDFMIQLSEQLTRPWLERRINVPTLQRSLKRIISEICEIPLPQTREEPTEAKRTTCYICPSKKRRMTSLYCSTCHQAFCAEHRARCCVTCDAEK